MTKKSLEKVTIYEKSPLKKCSRLDFGAAKNSITFFVDVNEKILMFYELLRKWKQLGVIT